MVRLAGRPKTSSGESSTDAFTATLDAGKALTAPATIKLFNTSRRESDLIMSKIHFSLRLNQAGSNPSRVCLQLKRARVKIVIGIIGRNVVLGSCKFPLEVDGFQLFAPEEQHVYSSRVAE